MYGLKVVCLAYFFFLFFFIFPSRNVQYQKLCQVMGRNKKHNNRGRKFSMIGQPMVKYENIHQHTCEKYINDAILQQVDYQTCKMLVKICYRIYFLQKLLISSTSNSLGKVLLYIFFYSLPYFLMFYHLEFYKIFQYVESSKNICYSIYIKQHTHRKMFDRYTFLKFN